MNKIIFSIVFVCIINFPKITFSIGYHQANEFIQWVGVDEKLFKKNCEELKEDDWQYQEQLDFNGYSLKAMNKKRSRSSSLASIDRQAGKEYTLARQKERRLKSITQGELLLNHKELVACMMACSHEKTHERNR